MNYEQMTAPCGLPCFSCLLYQINSPEILQSVRDAMAKDEALKMRLVHLEPMEEFACQGCREGKGINASFKLHGKQDRCRAYVCAEEKQHRFCCDCAEFPCDHLHPYAENAERFPHNTKVFNLCLIKKLGLETWAEEKAQTVQETYYSGKWKI